MSDYPAQDDNLNEDILPEEENPAAEDRYYSDDVQAEAQAETGFVNDTLEETKEIPVTSGDMQIGDLDAVSRNDAAGRGSDESYDEEDMPGGDNVTGE